LPRDGKGQRPTAIAGGSFRDFTRIAGSSPEMWESIFVMNMKEIRKDNEKHKEIIGYPD
jgi:prephenate dehydrogenase